MIKGIFKLLFLVPVFCWGQINVGPAIHNLNSRVTALENRPLITTADILAMGFLTNELDTIALGALGTYTQDHNIVHSELSNRISFVEGKADYPIRLYNVSSNKYLEFSGNTLKIYTNDSFCAQVATTNDLIPALDLITNNFLYLNGKILDIEQTLSNFNSVRNVKPYEGFLSVYSNTLYTATSEPSGIVFQSPEAYTNKESRITLHLYKGASSVTWFPNITWIYGASPEFQETGKTYVLQFESVDGNSWRGWVEYVY